MKVFLVVMILVAMFSTANGSDRGLVVVDRDGNSAITYGQSHALVIGISDYTNGWPDLPGVPKDINQVSDALEKQGFFVNKVIDPNHEKLLEAFDNFISSNGMNPENRLLIYYAGHGHTIRLSYGEETVY